MGKETLIGIAKALEEELEAKNCGQMKITRCTYRLFGRKHPVVISRTLCEEPIGFSIIEVFRKGKHLFWREPFGPCRDYFSDDLKRAKKIAIEFLKAKGLRSGIESIGLSMERRGEHD